MIARTLARELDLPLVEKDAIKELLYDEIGTGDREWSKRLGRASYAVMFHWLNVEVGGGRSIVAEANFDTIAARLIRELPPHRVFQVYCTASDDVLLRRYETRARHPGHVDTHVVEEMRRGD